MRHGPCIKAASARYPCRKENRQQAIHAALPFNPAGNMRHEPPGHGHACGIVNGIQPAWGHADCVKNAGARGVPLFFGSEISAHNLKQMPVLPIAFLGGNGGGIISGMDGVAGNVGGPSGVPGSAGNRAGGPFFAIAGGGVCGKRGGTGRSHWYFAARPRARRSYGQPGPLVFRILLLEMRQNVLRAVGGPNRQRLAARLAHELRYPLLDYAVNSFVRAFCVR
jgi:hypothetical protein